MSASAATPPPSLERLEPNKSHVFIKPTKKINDHQDVQFFLTSLAYRDIMTFVLQLNRSMFPSKISKEQQYQEDADRSKKSQGFVVQEWPLQSDAVEFSEPIRRLQLLLSKLESIIDDVPPDTGPRRFGNISFRTWCEQMEVRAADIMDECLPAELLRKGSEVSEDSTAKEELMAYFTGSFGSSQRLDYGTGHELSFLAFLACLWKLNAFAENSPGVEERGIVLGVVEPYLKLIRRLITTYTLEPAGSHGVWGLDDHSFIPYVFGSAQLSPAIGLRDPTPVEGSLPNAPPTGDVMRQDSVTRERQTNMYFSAIGFIQDVKRGPFWEHSPMLYDISGIKDGWGKINKGMVKMYNAEVLSKFPVVQHFPFGSMFRWEQDPAATPPQSSTHMSAGPQRPAASSTPPGTTNPPPDAGTRAPWATSTSTGNPRGQNMPPQRTSRQPYGTTNTTAMPPFSSAITPAATNAPWTNPRSQQPVASRPPPMTSAPWANKKTDSSDQSPDQTKMPPR